MRVTGPESDDKKVAERIVSEVQQIILEAWTPEEIAKVVNQDLDGMEQSVQKLLRLAGGRLMETLIDVGVVRHEGPAPVCPHCKRPMRLVDRRRKRQMHGLVGDFSFTRPYFHCRACGGGLASDDDRLGVGAGSYTPALSRVAAASVVDVPFERAARNLSETLGAPLSEEDIYRVVEGLGAVAEAEIQTAMTASEAELVVPDGDTLIMGMDGTMSFIEGDWHEVKVGVVGTLGPEVRRDPDTGRDLLMAKNPHYCAAANTKADKFIPRLKLLGQQAGLGHPALRRIVFISDGASWIWKRVPSLDQQGVERIDILDYYHVTEHVWRVADAFYGPQSLAAHAWVRPVLEGLIDRGPESLMAALNELRSHTKAQKAELRKAKDSFGKHLERMRYPQYTAMGLPIASGIVEAACRSVVCQRTKGPVCAGPAWEHRLSSTCPASGFPPTSAGVPSSIVFRSAERHTSLLSDGNTQTLPNPDHPTATNMHRTPLQFGSTSQTAPREVDQMCFPFFPKELNKLRVGLSGPNCMQPPSGLCRQPLRTSENAKIRARLRLREPNRFYITLETRPDAEQTPRVATIEQTGLLCTFDA